MTGDNVRQLRPASDTYLDGELINAARRVSDLVDQLDHVAAIKPTAVLAVPASPVAKRETLGGVPVLVVDELPGGADLLVAYDPTPPPEPPRKAHG